MCPAPRFSGEYTDPHIGLSHLRARDYDPATGRFTGLDPIAQDIKDPYVAAYLYVGDRPTARLDPSGLKDAEEDPCYDPPWYLEFGKWVCKTGKAVNDVIHHPAEAPVGTAGGLIALQDYSYQGVFTKLTTGHWPSELYYSGTNKALGINGMEPGTILSSILGPGILTCGLSALAAPERAALSTTHLFRAVDATELEDLLGTGVYRNVPGQVDGKYFFPTKQQAENFANLIEKGGYGEYCITSGCIDTSELAGIERLSIGGEGSAWLIPGDMVPFINDLIIHGPAGK